MDYQKNALINPIKRSNLDRVELKWVHAHGIICAHDLTLNIYPPGFEANPDDPTCPGHAVQTQKGNTDFYCFAVLAFPLLLAFAAVSLGSLLGLVFLPGGSWVSPAWRLV